MTTPFNSNRFNFKRGLALLKEDFSKESVVSTTTTTECCRGFFTGYTHSVLVWRSYQTIPINNAGAFSDSNTFSDSNIEAIFTSLSKIVSVGLPSVAPVDGGIDREGIPYVALKPIFGEALTLRSYEYREAERRFVLCANLIATLHENKVCLGNVTPGSFWASSDGTLCLLGILGVCAPITNQVLGLAFDRGIDSFIAPEVRHGKLPTAHSDVYSLGVLLALFFTGRLPKTDSVSGSVSTKLYEDFYEGLASHKSIPSWIGSVVRRATQFQPLERYGSAAELLADIMEAKKELLKGSSSLIVTSRANLPSTATDNMPDVRETPPARVKENVAKVGSKGRRSLPATELDNKRFNLKLASLGFSVLLIFGIFVGFLFWWNKKPDSFQEQYADSLSQLSSDGLRRAVVSLVEGHKSAEQKISLATLIELRDPLSFVLLAQGIQSEEKSASLLSAIKQLGKIEKCSNSIEVFLTELLLLKSSGQNKSSSSYAAPNANMHSMPLSLIQSVNPFIDVPTRLKALYDGFVESPRIVLNLLAALVVDDLPKGTYLPVSQEIIGAALNRPDLKNLDGVSLLLIHPDTAAIVAKKADVLVRSVPQREMFIVLDYLVSRNDTAMIALMAGAIAEKEGARRPAIKPAIDILTQATSKLTIPVASLLVRTIKGENTEDDLQTISDEKSQNILSVLDVDSKKNVDRLLWSMVLLNNSPKVSQLAFDLVTSRPNLSPLLKRSLNWIRQAKLWHERYLYSRFFAAIELADLVLDGDLRFYAKETIRERERGLLRVLLNYGSQSLSLLLLNERADLIGIQELVPLLNHKEPKVRIAALDNLGGSKDENIMRIIADRYRNETDESVQVHYRTIFPVLNAKAY
jgi:serine/threonine protein kinase